MRRSSKWYKTFKLSYQQYQLTYFHHHQRMKLNQWWWGSTRTGVLHWVIYIRSHSWLTTDICFVVRIKQQCLNSFMNLKKRCGLSFKRWREKTQRRRLSLRNCKDQYITGRSYRVIKVYKNNCIILNKRYTKANINKN
jgi:hypothetical protein